MKSQSVDLGPEIAGMSGRQLRMRLLKIEPGGHIGIHSHKDRPAVVYFLQGTDTVIAEDGRFTLATCVAPTRKPRTGIEMTAKTKCF